MSESPDDKVSDASILPADSKPESAPKQRFLESGAAKAISRYPALSIAVLAVLVVGVTISIATSIQDDNINIQNIYWIFSILFLTIIVFSGIELLRRIFKWMAVHIFNSELLKKTIELVAVFAISLIGGASVIVIASLIITIGLNNDFGLSRHTTIPTEGGEIIETEGTILTQFMASFFRLFSEGEVSRVDEGVVSTLRSADSDGGSTTVAPGSLSNNDSVATPPAEQQVGPEYDGHEYNICMDTADRNNLEELYKCLDLL
jgi:hypothetical protein